MFKRKLFYLALLVCLPSAADTEQRIEGRFNCQVLSASKISVDDGRFRDISAPHQVGRRFGVTYIFASDSKSENFNFGFLNDLPAGDPLKFVVGVWGNASKYQSKQDDKGRNIKGEGTDITFNDDLIVLQDHFGSHLTMARYYKSDWNAIVTTNNFMDGFGNTPRLQAEKVSLNCRHKIDRLSQINRAVGPLFRN